jgi:predicted Zn-dependent protease
MIMRRRIANVIRWLSAIALLLMVCALPAHLAAAATSDDPLLQALLTELERSKAQLKMENVAAPYYIEYRVNDIDEYDAEAFYGALRVSQRVHVRVLRAVVRVGDYQQDSYFGQGMGAVSIVSTDDDALALRRQLWWITDQAYKAAIEALTAKQAVMKQFTVDKPIDDFARADAVQLMGPLARIEVDTVHWQKLLEDSSGLFRKYPEVQSGQISLRFIASNRYFVNTEGSVTREGQTNYYVGFVGSTQARDGMRLVRSPYWMVGTAKELPTAAQLSADCTKMLETLKRLREAPLVEEEYRGPVLFSADAANDIFSGLVGSNVLGKKPAPGRTMRTTGDFATSLHSRVLPDFISVVDDPATKVFEGHSLVGSYEVDDEGVKAMPVTLIKNGVLDSYLMGRQPIRDFLTSNGHGRAGPGEMPSPGTGNLFVRSSQSFTREELKKKLIELCNARGLAFGFFADTLDPSFNPRLLYRVWAKDGREELVRGAVFNELDARALRNNLIAAGNDAEVSNRPAGVPSAIISPSILLDEVEVRPADATKDKLPEYPPPPLPQRKRP